MMIEFSRADRACRDGDRVFLVSPAGGEPLRPGAVRRPEPAPAVGARDVRGQDAADRVRVVKITTLAPLDEVVERCPGVGHVPLLAVADIAVAAGRPDAAG